MPSERFYTPIPLDESEEITIEDTEFHHLVNVMRIRLDESVEVVNGRGQLAKAIVSAIEKKRAFLKIQSLTTASPPRYKLILAQGLPKLNRLEFILEKGTELGVTEFHLFHATRSEKRPFTENQLERLQMILITAMKQCGRLFLPSLITINPINKWKALKLPTYFGDVSPSAPLLMDLWDPHQQSALVCIGPEAGFSDEEETQLTSLGAKGVKLHPNILRTETAALVALALLSHRLEN